MSSLNTSPPKLRPFNDSRVQYRSAHLNGHTYGYIFMAASSSAPKYRGTILLLHGFPDISFGWRYQIPFLSSLGLDVIAPDTMGYGRTDSPRYNLSKYTFRRLADDMAELCRQLNLPKILLGGHDWGAALAYRFVLAYPDLITAFFTICVPYNIPETGPFTPLSQLIATRVPNFGYQAHFASGEVEEHVQSPQEIRQFLSSLYGSRSSLDNKFPFSAEKGIDFDALRNVKTDPRLLTREEMDYYVQEYSRHGMNGPLNWYRTREINWWQDRERYSPSPAVTGTKEPEKTPDVKLHQTSLFIFAKKDQAIKKWMTGKMESYVPNLTTVEINAGHWVMWERSEDVNRAIGEWLIKSVWREGKESKL